MKNIKMKHIVILESIVIFMLAIAVGILGYQYYKHGDDLKRDSDYVLVADKETAIAVAETLIAANRTPLTYDIQAYDIGDYWFLTSYPDDRVGGNEFTMGIRKIDGCVVYCNMYGADDIPYDMDRWSKHESDRMFKFFYKNIANNFD